MVLRPSGRLRHVPAPLRPLVSGPLDLLRRALRRARSTFRRLAPRRIARTFAWLRAVFADHIRRRGEQGLRVAIDVDPLWLPLTGVGWYLRLVLEELRNEPGLRLRLYGPWMQGIPVDETVGRPSQPLPEGTAIDLVAHALDDDLSLPPGWQNRLLRLLQPLLIRFDRSDVVFAPNFIVPRRLRFAGAALVVTVHDLAMRKFVHTLADETKSLLDRDLDRALRTASRVITPSETIRQEILEEELFEASRVHAVLHGPGHLAVDLRAPPAAAEGAREGSLPPVLMNESGQPVPYAVHVGTIEPRKNLDLLLDVWEHMHETLPEARLPRLVWVGGVGWKSESLLERAQKGLEAGWLVRPGYVPDHDLRAVYRHALCVLMPSHYEGFGLPLVEAMVAGAPVVCSDIPVFQEVIAGAGVLLPNDRVEPWVREILRLRDEEARRSLIERGFERAAELDWARCARQTLEVWRVASSSRREGPDSLEGEAAGP